MHSRSARRLREAQKESILDMMENQSCVLRLTHLEDLEDDDEDGHEQGRGEVGDGLEGPHGHGEGQQRQAAVREGRDVQQQVGRQDARPQAHGEEQAHVLHLPARDGGGGAWALGLRHGSNA